jgi:formylglycine-generating enzyme required for sulfatase activity
MVRIVFASTAIIIGVAASLLLTMPMAATCNGIDVAVADGIRCLTPGAGKTEWFKDSAAGPEMVVVPAGEFTMGSPESEPGRVEEREEQITVTIPRLFAVGRFAVTRGEFAAFVSATGYNVGEGCHASESQRDGDRNRDWRSPGFAQDDRHPVVCVNWNDAKAYIKWLSVTTGKDYRLLSDSEREYVTRAGTTSAFWWGDSISPTQANYKAEGTVPVDSFAPNPWGLYNVIGGVLEWCEDCWREPNGSNPGDGGARTSGPRVDCRERVIRGGVWNDDDPRFMRAAYRTSMITDIRAWLIGFRVARAL